ncbi:hypothetical protein Tco_0132947 [Tanacetum coccineum]
MHTRASNSELVEPLLEPERTLNRRRHRRNRRVPFDQRNNPPKNPRIVYPPILDINHFCHFLVTLENLYPMDDEPMWAAVRVVTLTPGSAIIIPETANEFAIKGNAPKLSWSQSVQRQYHKNLLSRSQRNNPRSFECRSCDDEDEESTPQQIAQNPKPVKETLLPKPYKPKILYPQRLRKEKMEAQYEKFLDVIRAVRINVPLIDVLA